MNLKSKLPNISTTIFSVMTKLAADVKAINLGQGFPDFAPAEELIALVNQAMLDGHNQYPAMPGVLALRQQIAAKIGALYGAHYDVDEEITVTSGATEALMTSIQALVNNGDEVIVIEPYYDLYVPAVQLAGGTPVIVPMDVPNETQDSYSIDWNKIEDAISRRTRLIIVNSPHNPTGSVFSEDDLVALETLAEKYQLIVLSDEVYEHIVFGSTSHLSCSSRAKLRDRSVVISSFGKTYHTTGWKLGYCVAPKALMIEIRKVHQFTVFTAPSPFQIAMAKFMVDPSSYQQLPEFYRAKRDYLSDGLQNTKFRPLASKGTFFTVVDYTAVSDLLEHDFCVALAKQHGVAAIPLAAFYASSSAKSSNHGLIRLCFAKHESTLDEALDRLANVQQVL